MENLFRIIVILVLITFNSCDDHCTESYLSMVNNSGKDIEINSYTESGIDGKMIFSKKITLTNNNKYEKTLKDCGNNAGKFNFGAFVEGDSILIDYGDKIKGYSVKSKIYEARNPYILDGNNKANDFVYTLTPDDYANATPK